MALQFEDRPAFGSFWRYGREWPQEVSDLTIELWAFKNRLTPELGGFGYEGHARNLIDMLWNGPHSTKPFDWTPEAEKMLAAVCKWDFLAVAGCGSSGKTGFMACWAIINFLADPQNTTVLVTSTSIKDSKRRIFGQIMQRWSAVPGLPGKPVESYGMIKFQDPETGATSEMSGIFMIAGDPTKSRESVQKMVGFKSQRMFFIADELTDLSEAILQAALGNLSTNPSFQLIGLGNPNSYFDPFGLLAKPKAGWKSINQTSDEWETDYGYCLRFDAEKSTNYLTREVIYPWAPSYERIIEQRKLLGSDSPTYWRMYRGFWCPSGSVAGIYSEGDIALGDIDSKVIWREPPIRVGALDASFAANGDRAVALFGNIGTATDGSKILLIDNKFHTLTEDAKLTEHFPRDHQIAEQFMRLCTEEGVDPQNASMDSTGAGGPFASILSVMWSPGFHRTYFGGNASDRCVSSSDKRPANEVYDNRVTELWFAGKELLRTKQLKGLPVQAQKEMCSRLYETQKKGGQVVMVVEQKKKMKSRIGFSPDVADAVFIMVELCRERHGLISEESAQLNRPVNQSWDNYVRGVNNRAAGTQLRQQQRSIFDGGKDMPRFTGNIPLRRI